MSEAQLPNGTAMTTAQLVEKLDLLIKGKANNLRSGYVGNLAVWYERAQGRPHFWFRSVGALIVILSVTIPFVAATKRTASYDKDLFLSGLSLALAALSGLNAFFRWDQAARNFCQSQATMEHLLTTWELERLRALNEPDEKKAKENLIAVAKQIIDKASLVDQSDTDSYYKAAKLPNH